MKRSLLFILISLAIYYQSAAQTDILKPNVKGAAYFDVSPPLRNMQIIQPLKSYEAPVEVQNKIGHREFGNRISNSFPFFEDQVWQKQDGTYLPDNAAPLQNFEGINNLSNVYPPDTQGDIGIDKYVQVVNKNFAVYSRTGAVLLGPASLGTIWAGIPAPWNGTNSGDPIVLYDQAADRWIISQFSLPNSTQMAVLVAISQTSDPTGSWYRYVFDFGTKLPDYPKFGIWADGYYLSVNLFENPANWTWAGVAACALDRTKMLAGDPTASIVKFELPASSDPGSMLPADWDGANPPVTGEPNYFTYFDDWSHPTNDYLKMWALHVDWLTPANSTFTKTDSLLTAPFDAEICTAFRGRCIPQPSTTIKLETLSDRLMYRMQYRNFGTHRSMVTNHSVDVDGSGHAGIRWYELRKSGSAWSIYQQGTYAPDADHRWMGSVAMNLMGDIALGYSVSNSSSVFPSIRYTGRHANDPLGLMTISEQNIMVGTGSQTGTAARWGDYSMMSVDPLNDRTFWFTTEYVATTGSTTWRTRIASFLFDNTPSVTTLPATNITATTASLNGTINPNGLSTSYYFEYGTTTSYGTPTPTTSAGSIPGIQNITFAASGLVTGSTYHYRLVGVNPDGPTYGYDKTFIPVTTQIVSTPASAITSSGATSGGNIIADGGLTVTSRGVCWSTTPNPVITETRTTNGTGSGIFTSNITGLVPNTLYYLRAYAINSNGPYYGDNITFTTYCSSAVLPIAENFNSGTFPNCWTQQISYSTNNLWSVSNSNYAGATPYEIIAGWRSVLGETRLVMPPINTLGNVQLPLSFRHVLDTWDVGGVTLKVQSSVDGITWTDEAWTVATSASNIGPEMINTTITNNLNSATTFVAFTITGNLFNYDFWAIDNINITGVPTVITSPVSGITQTAAISGGEVSSDGGSPVTARGICWGTSPNPTTIGAHSVNGAGTGVFNTSAINLIPNTPYYIRAYATNSHGTGYGAEVPFRTLCIPSTLPFNEGFTNITIPDCWSQVDHQGNGQIWKFGVVTGQSPLPVLTGNYAYLDSDSYGSNTSQNADLVTPTIDLTAYGMVKLQFSHYYQSFNGQIGSLHYSIDNGVSWTLIQQFTTTSANPAVFSQTIPAISGKSQVKFKWNFIGAFGWYWGVDNIQLSGMPLFTPVLNVNIPNGGTSCYDAAQTIFVAGSGSTFVVQNGGSATMIAAQNILYYPGTRVFSGGYMHGYIAPNGPFCVTPPLAAVVTSAEEIDSQNFGTNLSFKIYPNPTNGVFTIDLTGNDIQESISVEIFGIRGEKVLEKKMSGKRSYDFNLENAPVGLYFVRIHAGQKTENLKVIKY